MVDPEVSSFLVASIFSSSADAIPGVFGSRRKSQSALSAISNSFWFSSSSKYIFKLHFVFRLDRGPSGLGGDDQSANSSHSNPAAMALVMVAAGSSSFNAQT